MVSLQEINSKPKFSSQLENKILLSNHSESTCASYKSTFSIKYVHSGTKFYCIDNKKIKVDNGQYLVLNDGNINTEIDNGTVGLSLFLSSKYISEILRLNYEEELIEEFLQVTQKNSQPQLKNLFDQIINLHRQKTNDFDNRIESLFYSISELIIKEQFSVNKKFQKLKIAKQETKQELYKSIIDAKTYCNDNFRNKISLETIARDIGISKYYLHRLFSEIFKVTPLEYIKQLRLNHAANQLRFSKKTISEIAILSGFNDTSYFSNVFKKFYGISPKSYREKQ